MSSNRMLIIDDEPGIAATIGKIARRCGYDPIITNDPEDFLARVRSWHPTVVVIDLSLPDMSGMELLTLLGSAGCDAQVLIVSGHDRQSIESARQLGLLSGLAMAGSLQKPLRVDALRIIFESINESVGIITKTEVVDALAAGQFHLLYQPKIDLRSMRAVGVEALSRWNNPGRSVISPAVFIPLIEEFDFINDFTRWVIDLAIPQVRQWRETGIDLSMAINVSAKDLRSLELDRLIATKCLETGVDIKQIMIELTETVAMERSGTGDALNKLVAMGAKLSIDDFGTGYSSLVQLHRLPFAEIKIDKSFVLECLSDRASAVIVRSIIDLAHNMDLKVIAEGVESEAILMHLIGLGCDFAQGYFFSPALGARDLATWVADWNAKEPSGFTSTEST